MDAHSLSDQNVAAAPGEEKRTAGTAAAEAQAEDTMTPKGTLFVLLVYAAVIVVLWGSMYVSMLLRR